MASEDQVDRKVQHPGGRDKNFSWVKTGGVWRKLDQKSSKTDEKPKEESVKTDEKPKEESVKTDEKPKTNVHQVKELK